MVTKWMLNKITAVIMSIAIFAAFLKYYSIYNFNVSPDNRLYFWVPLGVIALASTVIYIWTFKARRNDN